MAYRIGEVAQLTDVTATTIRYYEDCGLLARPARGANGYRCYDQRDVARVRFVSRARELQLSTDDLRDLVQAWETDDCGAVAQQMRAQVKQRRLDAQARIAELDELVGELQRVAVRLEGSPHSGACVDGECVCTDTTSDPEALTVTPDAIDGVPLDCTLEAAARPQRLDAWRALAALAVDWEQIDGGVALIFAMDSHVAGRIVQLSAAEQSCCTFFVFRLQITAQTLRLDITGPEHARKMLESAFGT